MSPHNEPTAAVLIIGSEVLSGRVDDVNGPFLIRALRARGVQVLEMRTVSDSIPTIAAALRSLCPKADYVFTTGGIGPTHDDVTIAGVAEAFNRPVIRDPELLHQLQQSRHKLNEARLKLAEVPQGAEVHLGDGSFVPVVQIENVFILPGVPSLMQACFAHVADGMRGAPFHSRALLLDVSESEIAAALTEVQSRYPDVAIGSYPRFDEAAYRVKVTVDGRDSQRVEAIMAAIRDRLETHWIVGEE